MKSLGNRHVMLREFFKGELQSVKIDFRTVYVHAAGPEIMFYINWHGGKKGVFLTSAGYYSVDIHVTPVKKVTIIDLSKILLDAYQQKTSGYEYYSGQDKPLPYTKA